MSQTIARLCHSASREPGREPAGGEHTCPVPRCSRRLGGNRILCKRHWSQLPAVLQIRLTRLWRICRADPRNEAKIAALAAAKQAAIELVTG